MLFADSPRKRMVHRVCETMCPFDGDLLKIHEAEVHFLSDSVPCLGKSAMASPEIKFTERRKEHVEYNKDAAKRIDRAQIPFLVPRRTRRCAASIRQGQGEEKPVLIEFFSWNEIPISSQGPKGGDAPFLRDADRNAACFRKFKPVYFMFMGPRSEKTWNLKRYPDNPKVKRNELAKQVTDVNLVQIQSW